MSKREEDLSPMMSILATRARGYGAETGSTSGEVEEVFHGGFVRQRVTWRGWREADHVPPRKFSANVLCVEFTPRGEVAVEGEFTAPIHVLTRAQYEVAGGGVS